MSVRKFYDRVCGKYNNEPKSTKKWIVDIDIKDMELVKRIWMCINEIQPEGDKKIGILETLNGYHIISKPFRVDEFKNHPWLRGVSVHKDSPTNLYIPL